MKKMIADKKGASLVYMIIFSGILWISVLGATDSLKRALARYEDLGGTERARGAAYSLKEKAVQESVAESLGYENPASGPQNLYDLNGDGTYDIYGNYEIWARAKRTDWRTLKNNGDSYATYAECAFSNLCVAPVPGTGNAGDGCDFTDTTQGWAQPTSPSTPTTGLNNDCNWNKLHYGEVVSFPLYYEDAGCTGGICNPAELGLGTFILRIRTPNGETLNTLIDLNEDGDTTDSGENDPVVVNWEITGDCDTDGFLPEEAEESCWMIGVPRNPDLPTPYSLIYASKVNTATSVNYEVLDESYRGDDYNPTLPPTVSEFLTENESTIGYEILNPLLTLSVVSPLENLSNFNSIPYLEYQIQVDKPISDNKSSIHAIGKAKGKLGTYVWPLLDYLGIAENPLIQFVIQN